jgi:hypothetical protein
MKTEIVPVSLNEFVEEEFLPLLNSAPRVVQYCIDRIFNHNERLIPTVKLSPRGVEIVHGKAIVAAYASKLHSYVPCRFEPCVYQA